MSPAAQAATGAIVAGVIALSVLAVFELLPWIWWTVFVFWCVVCPASGLFLRVMTGGLDSDGGGKH